MEITIHWYYLVIALFLIPFGYSIIRKPVYGYDIALDVLLITAVSWSGALGLLLGKLF